MFHIVFVINYVHEYINRIQKSNLPCCLYLFVSGFTQISILTRASFFFTKFDAHEGTFLFANKYIYFFVLNFHLYNSLNPPSSSLSYG